MPGSGPRRVDDTRSRNWPRQIAALIRDPSVRGIAGGLFLKAAMIVANFTLIVLAANVLQEVEFGEYAILLSAAGLIGVIAVLGQQLQLMRSWHEFSSYNDPASLKGALSFGAALWLAGTTIAAVCFYFGAGLAYGDSLGRAATVYLVISAAIQTTGHLLRSAVGVTAGDGISSFLPVLPAIAYLAYSFATQADAQSETVLYLLASGSVVGLTVHIVLFVWRLRSRFPNFRNVSARRDLRAWAARSMRLWMSSCLEAANQFLDVLLVGLLTSPAVAGAYFVTTRFANIFASASDGVHLFTSRHVPDLFFRREHANLAKLLDLTALALLAMITIGIAGILVGGKLALGVISPDYVQYYPALIVLCIGTATAASAQPCASILIFTGHEGRYLTIIATSVGLRVAGFLVLVPSYGMMGAVTASAMSFIVLAAALSHSTKRLAGFDGSVLRLIGRPQRNADAGGIIEANPR